LYLVVDPPHKPDALRRCIHALDAQRVLIFMNYQQRLKDTMFKLEARKMKV
jgi:superfamily II DNA/RNA helicase